MTISIFSWILISYEKRFCVKMGAFSTLPAVQWRVTAYLNEGVSTGIVYTKHKNSCQCLWNYCQFPILFQELCGLESVTHDIHLRQPTTGWISHAGQLTWLYNMSLLSLMCLVLVL